jgi:hypothetical protein
VAEKVLDRRRGQIAVGFNPRPQAERTSIQELADDYFLNYRVKNISNLKNDDDSDPDVAYIRKKAEKRLDWTEKKWNKHLKAIFGGMRASRLSTDDLTRYIAGRVGHPGQSHRKSRDESIA